MSQTGKIIPVILCGGAGTRIWPISRQKSPKQFHNLIGEDTLFAQTLKRASLCTGCAPGEIITVTAEVIFNETAHQLADFSPATLPNMLIEPSSKNTAAAVAYAALHAEKTFGKDSVLWIIPSDHYVQNLTLLTDRVQEAAKLANQGFIATFGIKPSRPHTEYGYIKVGKAVTENSEAVTIDSFKEKPDLATARHYFNEGDYLWNSGMFVAKTSALLEAFNQYCPLTIQMMREDLKNSPKVSLSTYSKLPSVPFDIAIMEKTDKGVVIPCNMGWNDIGTWDSIWEISEKDENNNVIIGNVSADLTENCYIQSTHLNMATLGIQDLVIIEYIDTIFIADKKLCASTSMKQLVSKLNKKDEKLTNQPPHENRPWGSYKILNEGTGYKTKEITIKPGGKQSLQMHSHRSEFWTVVKGIATITLSDEIFVLYEQQSTTCPAKTVHRVENNSDKDLILIEVQCGSYLGEDDIIRFDDVYKRNIIAQTG